MATEVKVPTLGESITEATLGQWLKQPGDAVAADEPIASLETDKVAVEVNAPVAGTMGEQLVKEGDTVAVGAVIARIEAGGGAAAAADPQPRRRSTRRSIRPGAGENAELHGRCRRSRGRRRRTSPCRRPSVGSCSSIISIRRRSRAPARTAA